MVSRRLSWNFMMTYYLLSMITELIGTIRSSRHSLSVEGRRLNRVTPIKIIINATWTCPTPQGTTAAPLSQVICYIHNICINLEPDSQHPTSLSIVLWCTNSTLVFHRYFWPQISQTTILHETTQRSNSVHRRRTEPASDIFKMRYVDQWKGAWIWKAFQFTPYLLQLCLLLRRTIFPSSTSDAPAIHGRLATSNIQVAPARLTIKASRLPLHEWLLPPVQSILWHIISNQGFLNVAPPLFSNQERTSVSYPRKNSSELAIPFAIPILLAPESEWIIRKACTIIDRRQLRYYCITILQRFISSLIFLQPLPASTCAQAVSTK